MLGGSCNGASGIRKHSRISLPPSYISVKRRINMYANRKIAKRRFVVSFFNLERVKTTHPLPGSGRTVKSINPLFVLSLSEDARWPEILPGLWFDKLTAIGPVGAMSIAYGFT